MNTLIKFLGAVTACFIATSDALSASDSATEAIAALLHEQDQPAGLGSVAWRVDRNHRQQVQWRGDVVIPDRELALTLILRRNDPPASMLAQFAIELDFSGSSSSRKIAFVLGIGMKATGGKAEVKPLAGNVEKAGRDRFVVNLSDRERPSNVLWLGSLNWFEIWIEFSDGHRAFLSVAKSGGGQRTLIEAFRDWNEFQAYASSFTPPGPPPKLLPPPVSKWKSFEADNGAVFALDMATIDRRNACPGCAVAVICIVDNNVCNIMDQRQILFDCRGHYMEVLSHGGLQMAPPRSVIGRMAAEACIGATTD